MVCEELRDGDVTKLTQIRESVLDSLTCKSGVQSQEMDMVT